MKKTTKKKKFLQTIVSDILSNSLLTYEEYSNVFKEHKDRLRRWWRSLKEIHYKKGIWFKSEKIEEEWIPKIYEAIRIKDAVEKGTWGNSSQYSQAKNYDSSGSKLFLLTWAQNATPIHINQWNNMLVYAEHIGATIHVIAGRYKNPTSLWTQHQENDEWWDDNVIDYLDANRHMLNNNLMVMSDIKIQPTAVNPLSGMQGMGKSSSCIYGHPRLHMEVLPALEGHHKKRMYTTGALTIPNYTDSKVGAKGEFYHMHGFLVVEVRDEEVFYCREVSCDDDGNFIDLFWEVYNGEIIQVDKCDAIVYGDIHTVCLDKKLESFRRKNLLDKIKPTHLILHDICDSESISHHSESDPFTQYKNYATGRNLLEKEIEDALKYVENNLQYNPVVVRSNHDEFIDRYLSRVDWRKNIPNAKEHLKYSLLLLEDDAPQGILPFKLQEKFGKKVTALGRDDSFVINSWELSYHGDIGTNGSRGSLNQYRRLNVKMIIGHSHTPGRKDNVVQVGTSTKLRVGYNKGPSSWMWCDAILHKNGKVQLIVYNEKDYSFTTLKNVQQRRSVRNV